MTYVEMIDHVLDGPSDVATTLDDGFRQVLAIHRLARAVEALAKTPIPLPMGAAFGFPGVPTDQTVLASAPAPPAPPKGVVATAYVCQECNARNVVAEKIQHSPNCPQNPVRKGK